MTRRSSTCATRCSATGRSMPRASRCPTRRRQRLRDGFARRLLVQNAQYDRLGGAAGRRGVARPMWRRRPTEPSPSAVRRSAPPRTFCRTDLRAGSRGQHGSAGASRPCARASPAAHGCRLRRPGASARCGRAWPAGSPEPCAICGPPWRPTRYPAFAPTASTDYAAQPRGADRVRGSRRAHGRSCADALRVAADLPPLDAHERAALSAFAPT